MVQSDYSPPLLYRSSALATIAPNLFRPVSSVHWKVEKHETPDHDVFFTGSLERSSSRCALLLHGLEGSMNSRYMYGMAHTFLREGFDVIALNHRGCGGFENLQPYSYHSGFIRDLQQALSQVEDRYEHIWLIGFSLGGNVALKYALHAELPNTLRGIVAISAPLDLAGSSATLSEPRNLLYEKRFLRTLKQKAARKKQQHPDSDFDLEAIRKSFSLRSFDDAYTAPVNGFKDALDYYAQNSTHLLVQSVSVPTLVINAQNDSFLSAGCYPTPRRNLHVLTPRFGGHVGFPNDLLLKKQFWHEVKAMEFIKTFTP